MSEGIMREAIQIEYECAPDAPVQRVEQILRETISDHLRYAHKDDEQYEELGLEVQRVTFPEPGV